jgi:hypothetical protein
VQPLHTHTHVHVLFFSFLRSRSAYLSITPEPLFFLHYRFSFPPLSPVSACNLLIVLTRFVSSLNPGLIRPCYHFVLLFCVRAGRPSSCHRSGLRPKKLRVAGSPPSACFEILYFLSSFPDPSGVYARCGKSLSFVNKNVPFFLFSPTGGILKSF